MNICFLLFFDLCSRGDWDDGDETGQEYQLNTWRSVIEPPKQPRSDQVKTATHHHVTDDYIQEFGQKQSTVFAHCLERKQRFVHIDRPALYGELCMTFGTPQSGPKTNCMPIGVALSHDELTLLSCDVHRDAQHVRLFDIRTGRLKQTISSNQVRINVMKEIEIQTVMRRLV